MNNWTWESVLENLEQRVHMPKTAPALSKTQNALTRLKLKFPDSLERVIVVAGTNGKGTTSKSLECLLRAAGQKTALYTSPHMIDINERIEVGGEKISHELFVRAFTEVETACASLELTHFEVITLMAAWVYFSPDSPIENIDYFIFEVGMGGTWDATNAIPHRTNVITRLGLDHVPVLGTTLAEIAANKFGIIGQDSRVISQPLDISLNALREEVIDEMNCEWVTASPFEVEVRLPNPIAKAPFDVRRFPEFVLFSRWGSTPISLPGSRAAENMNLALSVFNELGFEPSLYLSALADVRWPGRMERLISFETTCPVFFSGDHNEQGVASLVDLLRFYRFERLHLIISVGVAKDLNAMLAGFQKLERADFTFTSAGFLGRALEQYGDAITESSLFFKNPLDALAAVSANAKPGDIVIFTGSLYTYADLFKR